MAENIAIAIAGNGTVTQRNASSLLNNFIPEDADVSPFTVEKVTRAQKGLKVALGWFEGEGLEVELTESPLDKVDEYSSREDASWNQWLIIVLDPENEDDQALVKDAHSKGITVFDLANGFDEVLPQEDEPEVGEDDSETVASSTEAAAPAVVSDLSPADVALLKAFATALRETFAGGVAAVRTPFPDEPPFEDYEFIGSDTKQPGTTPFFMTEDGQYRNAEGRRKKANETKLWLTDEEIAALPRAVYTPES